MSFKAFVMACGISGQAFELLADTPVEAFDHSVCLRPEWLCELVDDAALSTQAIERMSAGRSVFGLVLFVYGKAVGPLAAVVGENGVDFDIEAFKEAPQERGGSFATSVIEDFDVDEACRAINRDIGVSPLFAERWRVFDVDVDKSCGRGSGEYGDGFARSLGLAETPLRCRQRCT